MLKVSTPLVGAARHRELLEPGSWTSRAMGLVEDVLLVALPVGCGVGSLSALLLPGLGAVAGGIAAVGVLALRQVALRDRPGPKERAAYLKELRARGDEPGAERVRLRVLRAHAHAGWVVRALERGDLGVLLAVAPERFVWLRMPELGRELTREVESKWTIELLPESEGVLKMGSRGASVGLRAIEVRADESTGAMDRWPVCSVLELADLPAELARAVGGDVDVYRR